MYPKKMNNIISVEFLKFGVVGVVGIFIDFFITWLCKEKLQLNKYVANSIGFSIAVINNFLLNRYWTFKFNNQTFTQQFLQFAIICIIGLIINNLLLYVLNRYIKLNFYLLKLFVIGIVFFWNFFMNKMFTFHPLK